MTQATVPATTVCPFDALLAFAQQRPGIEPGNYGSFRDYRQESRQVTQDLHDVRLLMQVGRWRIPADALTDNRPHRRLTWDATRQEWDYTTGQYFAVEYRKAAARLLAEGIGRAWMDRNPGFTWPRVRLWAREAFGRRIASRYF